MTAGPTDDAAPPRAPGLPPRRPRLGRLLRRLAGFGRDEQGSATVEFALVMPILMGIFIASFELGMVLTRQVMLDRGLDMTVRDVRLGLVDPVTHDTVKAMICNRAGIIPDCMDNLKLEMRRVDPRDWSMLGGDADCIDRANPSAPVRTFVPGQMNELMVLRACALFDPFFPTTGIGFQLAEDGLNGEAYALLSFTSYVIEPL